jgi:hypothetical protein
MRDRNPPPAPWEASRTTLASSFSSESPFPPFLVPAPLTPGGSTPTVAAAEDEAGASSKAEEVAMSFVVVEDDEVRWGVASFSLRISIIPSMHSSTVFKVPPSKKWTILDTNPESSGERDFSRR